MFSEEVRKEIIQDIKCNFKGFKGQLNDNMFSNMLSVYEKFISYPDELPAFAGYHKVEKIITAYYSTGSIDELLEEASDKFLNFEPFLKKLFYMVNPDKYLSYKPHTLMVRELMLELDIYESLPNGAPKLKSLSNHFTGDKIAMENCIKEAYAMRQDQAHTWPNLSRRERAEYFSNVLSVCIYLCHRNRQAILNKCSLIQHINIDLPDMCEKIVKEYEKDIKNGFCYVPMRWISEDGNEIWGKENEELKHTQNQPIRIQFSGEAGCGKTTIARHFIYKDAKKYLNYVNNGPAVSGQIPKVPLSIELKTVSEGDDIIGHISRLILKCSETETLNKLRSGIFTLYLDGVNEMINSRSGKRIFTLSVNQLLQECPDISVIVTDRDQVDINLRNMLTVYLPSKPGLTEILYFVEMVTKNKPKASETLASIRTWLEEDSERCNRFNTPFKISRLIQISESGKDLSDNEQEFIHAYVTALLERELVEKKDYMAEPGRLDEVLSYVAKFADTADCKLDRRIYFNLCSEVIKDRSLSMDAVDCGNLAIQLGFLCLQGDNTVSFSDEPLFYYFKNL